MFKVRDVGQHQEGRQRAIFAQSKDPTFKALFLEEQNGLISKAAGTIVVLHEKTAQSMILGDQIQVRHIFSV